MIFSPELSLSAFEVDHKINFTHDITFVKCIVNITIEKGNAFSSLYRMPTFPAGGPKTSIIWPVFIRLT